MTFEQMQARLKTLVENPPVPRSEVTDPASFEVVWSGGELLPDRASKEDDRLSYVPSYDLDEGESSVQPQKRRYNFTGNHTKEKRAVLKRQPKQVIESPTDPSE